MTSPIKSRSVSLTFRGFCVDPNVVEQLLGVKSDLSGRAGMSVRPGVKSVLGKSFVEYSVYFDKSCRLDEMIPALLIRLGGLENILAVRREVSPELFELNFTLPVKLSDEQESGFITAKSIADVFELGCSMSFEFI